MLLNFIGKENLLNFVRSQNRNFNCKYFGHFFGRAPYSKSLIRTDLLDSIELIKFSEKEFSVISNLDEYLANRFGKSYMEMPSEKVKASFPSHCIEFSPRKEVNFEWNYNKDF